MEIKILEEITIRELTNVFNKAFADYTVKVHLTEENMLIKMKAENILLHNSVGAFIENNLIGFILIRIDSYNGKNIAYNGGTGVIPEYRGNKMTNKMYSFISPVLKSKNIHHHQLEVISQNTIALKVYENLGFSKLRTLSCLKGRINTNQKINNIPIVSLDSVGSNVFKFWNKNPSWQNSSYTVARTTKANRIVGAFQNKKLIGYIIYSPETGRIMQFGVDKESRRMGVGKALFFYTQNELKENEMIIINVDKEDKETILFLEHAGLQNYIEQFEMLQQFYLPL